MFSVFFICELKTLKSYSLGNPTWNLLNIKAYELIVIGVNSYKLLLVYTIQASCSFYAYFVINKLKNK